MDVQTFVEISASVEDYGCAEGGNKHVSIAISVLNDWLPKASSPSFFFSLPPFSPPSAFDKLGCINLKSGALLWKLKGLRWSEFRHRVGDALRNGRDDGPPPGFHSHQGQSRSSLTRRAC